MATWPLARRRLLVRSLAAGAASTIGVLLVVWCASEIAQAQAPGAPWTTPRTADGRPDLQGIWTNATITPLERPRGLADKTTLTEAEVVALEQQAAERREASDRFTPGEVGSYNQFWFDAGTKVLSTRQTSLVVDPPDGRVPVTAAAEARRDYNLAHQGDSFEHMSVWDRCITRGVPGSMFPAGYNNAYQIVQTPGYVVIFYEMIHDARIVPLDRRPSAPSRGGFWMGDSRGRWEGDTLVIETTNFHDRGWISTSAASGRIKGIPHSAELRVVERLRRTASDTISYTATIEDPAIYTRPWTVSFPLTADPEYRIYEYACHEGNYAMEGMLRGARAQEAAAAKKSKTKEQR
ncbi:MAG: hypothetical protein ACT4QD_18600 [Acidobacteriota bacterium]